MSFSTKRFGPTTFCFCLSAALLSFPLLAQDLPLTPKVDPTSFSPLDPTRNGPAPKLESSIHKPLPEEYIWTANDALAPGEKLTYKRPGRNEQTEPHYFRHSFTVASVPSQATLYIAGPRKVTVWLNGQQVESVESDTSSPLGMHVFATDVAKFLRSGKNTIAIEAVRGRGVSGFANSPIVRQQTFGQVLVAKILPAAPYVNATPLMITTKDWKSTTHTTQGWQTAGFDDSSWKPVQSIGGIESDIELYQWNADAGLYDWPGYDGVSGFLAHVELPYRGVVESYAGRGSFLQTPSGDIRVHLPSRKLSDTEAPSLLLDFGRELTGRVELSSESDTPAVVTIQVGESEPETINEPYLGVNQLVIPAHGTAHGPKSSFRYAKIRFVAGGPELHFKSIHADHIYYPVSYTGSFESSDKLLNRIWEVGAYTTHLCMQDGIWDAPKRDRGRWMGDTDVSGRVISDVFGDQSLMEDTLDRLIGPAPVDQHVNGIPGYSSFWFTELADYYRHTGSKRFLEKEHGRLVQLLQYVDAEFDEKSLYANKTGQWLYVDWSPEFNGDTSETRRATTLEFYRAYREAAWLLRELNDNENAEKYEKRAAEIKVAANRYLITPETATFGPRWQTNAAAVISGVADSSQYPAIWDHVFSSVGHIKYNAFIITPYYNYYVIRAMAETGHRKEALDWIRQYWGGMINQGATSFWEGYDPSWYKSNFHASLQADNSSGYFVSLAHGWSAGPTAWLMEEVLGINPTGPGFSTVDIHPDLAGLDWAKGAEPTPHGLLKVETHKTGTVAIDLPEGVSARVFIPVTSAGQQISVDGKTLKADLTEDGHRRIFSVATPGHHIFQAN